MPNINSFISPSIFSTETTTIPLYAAMLAGSTFYPPTFGNGGNSASTVDPGGLFGWLVYSRTQRNSPAKGATTDTYLVYTNPNDFVFDVNKLDGVTLCLIAKDTQASTYGFFAYNAGSNEVTPSTIGYDFIHALNYLSYGGVLILAGSCTGLNNYESQTTNKIDLLIGQTANASTATYVRNSQFAIGVFPSINGGLGYTAASFDTLFPAGTSVAYSSGATVANRIFNVGGQSKKGPFSTDSLQANTTLLYQVPSVSDAAGAFVRSKNDQSLPLTVAGIDFSTPLNTEITNKISWSDVATKDIYKKNRVNFYSYVQTDANTEAAFLGLDLIGATAAAGSTYNSGERIGPAYLKNYVKKNVENILLKYVFQINNAATRASVTTEINLFIQGLNQYLDTTFTQIVCDSSNNTDNGTTLNAEVTVKPILATETFSVSVSTVST